MENAVDALKMAFAVMAFMLALSVSVTSFNKVKEVSDVVLYTKDETNYYEYQGIVGKAAQNRIVGIETIIPTLYKYYKENYTVVFRHSDDYDYDNATFSNVEPLKIYTTPSRYMSGDDGKSGAYLWGKGVTGEEYSTYDLLMYKKYNKHTYDVDGKDIVSKSIFDDVYDTISSTKKGNKEIFSFDLEEETLRHEPWTGSYEKAKENLRCFLNGEKYYNPNSNNNSVYIDYKAQFSKPGGFIGNYYNCKFVETVAEYTYSSNQADSIDTEDQEGSTINSLVKEKNKRIIIYTLIK